MSWLIEEWFDSNGVKYWEIYDDDGNHVKHYDNLNYPDNTTGIPGLRLPQDIRGLVFDQHENTPSSGASPGIGRRGLEIVMDGDWQIVRKQI